MGVILASILIYVNVIQAPVYNRVHLLTTIRIHKIPKRVLRLTANLKTFRQILL